MIDLSKMGPVELANTAFNDAVATRIVYIKQSIFEHLRAQPDAETYEYVFHGVNGLIRERVMQALANDGFTVTKVKNSDAGYHIGGWLIADKSPYR